MAGDISRSSFQPGKGNTGVRMQQGRVLLDADWNEQLDIQAYRERTLTTDLLLSAAPQADPGFGITASSDGQSLIIGVGRMYVEGILCENHQQYTVAPPLPPPSSGPSSPTVPPSPGMSIAFPTMSFMQRVDMAQKAKMAMQPLLYTERAEEMVFLKKTSTSGGFTEAHPSNALSASPASSPLPVQPYLPSLPSISKGTYVAYLDVWERDITVLEDPSIREVALGGPDTTTRTRVVWQVKLLPYNGNTSCPHNIYSQSGYNPNSSSISARAAATDPSSTPCVIPATAGYRSLENQLYRVEVHTPGQAGTATFKWSRDNASVVVGWQSGDTNLSVTSLGRDDVLGFAAGQWIELNDDSREYAALPGTLVQLSNAQLVGQAPTLTIDPTTAASSAPVDFASFPVNPKVRRWDQSSSTTLSGGAVPITEGSWIDLENGVQIQFDKNGTYHTGDYWLIPARTSTTASQPTVLWPTSGDTPLSQPPQGIVHHLVSLAVVNYDGQNWSVLTDCRNIFAPITGEAGANVTRVSTLTGVTVTPKAKLSTADLLSGIRVFFDRPIDPSTLNVSTLTIRIDLPATDERFAETATPNQQVPAAMEVKALGFYATSNGSDAVWTPFPSTKNYVMTRLAAFGALTFGQGRAQLRIQINTTAILPAPQASFGQRADFELSAFVQPYTDPTKSLGPLLRLLRVYGPDASGDYLAFGYMLTSIYKQWLAMPTLDVAGNKIYAQPFQIISSMSVYAYVPTALERQGNFSAFSLPIHDATGAPIPNNTISPNVAPPAGANGEGLWAVRFRAYVPPPTPYTYGTYSYYGGSAVGGELI